MPIAVYAFMLVTAVCASLLAGAWASRQAKRRGRHARR